MRVLIAQAIRASHTVRAEFAEYNLQDVAVHIIHAVTQGHWIHIQLLCG